MKGELVKVKGFAFCSIFWIITLLTCFISNNASAQIDLDFSHKRGLYTSSFQLAITADDPSATIYYTIDGSDPSSSNGTSYNNPLNINSTTILKVFAIGSNQTSNLKVHSYIFPDQAINQANSFPGFPSSNFALDNSILNHPTYENQLLDGMYQIPTVSVVMDLDTLNALHGGTLEHKTSFEVIMTDGEYVQEFGGIERAGGSSFNSAKRNLRITFKSQYGAKRLDFPLFGKEATNNIDQIAIRPGFHGCMHLGINHSRGGSNDLSDEIVRRYQINMSDDKIGLHGLFAHLYLNGVYWGVYNLTERANDGFNESYFGGDNEDYDVIKRKLASSGNLTAWNELNNLANNTNLAIQSNYENIKDYVDVDNFAEYVILCNYAPHSDDHASGKNSFATMDRTKTDGFKFWIWDTEPALGHYWTWNVEPFGSRPYNNIFLSLLDNEDFKILVSDKIECNCYNDGPLDNNKSTQTYLDLYNSVNKAMLLEAARWQTVAEYTELINTKDRIVNDYLPTRPDFIKDLYRTQNVYPNIEAASFNHAGGIVPNGTQVSINNPNASGTIYYTTNGQDPRDSGGGINNSAQSISNNGSVTLSTGVVELKARIFQNGTWSAMCPKKFYVNQAYQNLQINEIHYNPLDSIGADGDIVDSDNFEFIEIKNTGNTPIHLEDVSLVDGISFIFEKNTSIAPGGFVVLAEGATQFQFLYGMAPTGTYNGKLKNSGEQVLLADPLDNIIDQVAYSDDPPWDDEADNGGPSLALLLTPNIDNALPESWAIQVVDYTPFAENAFCTPITINEFVFDVSCRNGNDGFLQVSVNGGASPYNYAWSNGGNSSSIASLSAGSYTVTVTDANLCTETKTISISQPSAAVSITINKQDQTNYNINNGSATASVSGGTPGYLFNWSTGSSNQTINDLAPGNYTVTVTDDNSCTEIKSITIDQVTCDIIASANHTDISYFGNNDGSATANPSGGPSPYSYNWSNGSSTPTISSLVPGNYNVTITAANGCFDLASFTIDEVDCTSFSLSLSKTDETYLNTDDGSATANPIGTAPFTYIWSNGQNTKTINNLSPGSYTVTATDAVGCSAIESILIDAIVCNSFSLSTSSTNVSFVNADDGTATATPSGVAPYSYTWSEGSTISNINGLAPGTYTVTVVDAVGCSGTAAVNIGDINCTGLGLSFSSTDESTFGISDGTATANPSGGNSPYSYAWSNGATSATINGLAAGTYEVTITDDLACSLIDQVEILAGNTGEIFGKIFIDHNQDAQYNAGDEWLAGIDVVIVESNGNTNTVTTDVNGQWTAIVKTGLTSVDIDENNLPIDASQNLGTDPNLYNVAQGEIKDAGLSGYLLLCANITLNSTINQMVSCNGLSDGSVSLQTIDGKAPYTYAWSDGSNSDSRNNLTANNYTVTVTDDNACSSIATIVITEPNILSASVSKTDESYHDTDDGTASLIVNGGTSPYTYLWSNGATTSSITDLAPGNYTVVITDDNGCEVNQSVSISPVDCLNLTLSSSHNDISYFGWSDGSASATASGGATPYSYVWSNGATTQNISDLAEGNYSLTVIDNLGCEAMVNVSIDPVDCSSLSLSVTSTDLSSFGANDGTLTTNVTGGAAPYTYLWNTGQVNPNLTGMSPGTYTLSITDNLGCETSASAVINNVDCSSLSLIVNASDETQYQANDGSASALANGGQSPYQYSWSNGASTQSVSNLPPGNYAVTLTDDNACTTIKNFNILQAQNGYLSGKIYEDKNNSGSFDATDTGIANVDIRITESDGNSLTVTTDASGDWISIVRPGLSLVSIIDSGAQLNGATQSEGNDPTLVTAVLGQTIAAGDDGFNFFTELCGKLFYDRNANGVKENNETALANVSVIITDQLGIDHNVMTDATGQYCLEIIPGTTSIYVDIDDANFPSGASVTQNTNPQSFNVAAGSNQAFDMGFFRLINLDIQVFLQGALNVGSGQLDYGTEMRTELNDIQVLPGQTYLGGLFSDIYFPPGQPYQQAPWLHDGQEGAAFDSGGDPNQADAGYPAGIVDWILVSLRTGILKSDEVCVVAALLDKDGQIQLQNDFDCDHLDNAFYLVVEHRNHMVVMSESKIPLNNGLLQYDFTTHQSYTDAFGLSVGQKEIVNINGQTRFVMISGNADQTSSNSADTDTNVNDKIIWEQSNNDFPVYIGGDFDLSGDTNVNDKLLWDANNNSFSSVPR